MSESETAESAGEFIWMDQGDIVPAAASPGKLSTTLEFPKDDGEGEGGVGCKVS